jgi:DNA helicase II / ATP-dependent DNA helicase PcrA
MIKATRQQIEVIESDAPLKRVIACAGSGKTWVLTRSIIRALESGWCRPEEILALTFTINAAENMRQRVRRLTEKKDLDLDMYTFNSFGNEIIYQNSFELGLGKDFRLITGRQSWQVLYQVFSELDLSGVKIGRDTGKFLQDLLSFIEDMKNNLISVKELEKYLDNRRIILESYRSKALRREEEETALAAEKLVEVYRRYEAVKRQNNMIDYSDQVFLPYMLFGHRKAIREKYSQKYRYILIDEFQDTNVAQARFLTRLYKKGYNRMMIVGDDDQGIYSFRGACVNNILDFGQWECFGGQKVSDHFLSVNFRSGAGIIESTHSVIRQNRNRFDKKVTAGDKSKESRIFFNLDRTLEEEAVSISGYIEDLIYNKGLKPGDIAVLSRVKRFQEIAESLKARGIRYELVGNRNFYYEPEILFIISWLRIIDDITDEISMAYILKSDRYKIGDRDMFFLKKSRGDGSRTDLVGGIRDCRANRYLSPEAKERLGSFLASLLLYIKRSGMLDLKELISLIFEDSGLLQELRSGLGPVYRSRMRNVENLIRIAADFKKSSGDNIIDSFITYIRDVAVTGDDPDTLEITGDNAVKLMSIHAAKGLEFKAVILPMLWKDHYLGRSGPGQRFVIPSVLRKDSPLWQEKKDFSSAGEFAAARRQERQEEERRIFYVACSRAKSILIFSHSRYGSQEDLDDEGKKPRDIVPFFIELAAGSSRIIPLGEEEAAFLSEMGAGCLERHDIGKEKYFGGKGKETARKAADRTVYDWKKAEDRLAEEVRMFSVRKSGLQLDRERSPVENIGRKEPVQMPAPLRESSPAGGTRTGSGKKGSIYPLTPLLDYLECPVMYKWRYVHSIPGKYNEAMETGEKVHKYIEDISRLRYRKYPAEKNRILAGADKEIRPFIEAFLDSRLAGISPGRPGELFLERLFYYRTRDRFITGKLDRLDLNGEKAEIIDYKTGRYRGNSLSRRYRLQLSVYMAAVCDILGIAPGHTMGSILFLGDGKIITVQGKSRDIKSDIRILTDAIDSINRHQFQPVEGRDCRRCSYRHLCSDSL